MFSATITKPVCCIKPKPESLLMFPVAKKFSIVASKLPPLFSAVIISSVEKENKLRISKSLNDKIKLLIEMFI